MSQYYLIVKNALRSPHLAQGWPKVKGPGKPPENSRPVPQPSQEGAGASSLLGLDEASQRRDHRNDKVVPRLDGLVTNQIEGGESVGL